MKTTNRITSHFIARCIGILCISLVSFKITTPQHDTPSVGLSWKVLPNSFITINGRSNINKFGCDASGSFQAEPLHGNVAKDGKSIAMTGSISIAINQFDCHNRMLTADLRKTLKAAEYPQMTIRFVSLERMPICDGGEDFITGKVIIELAGQRKSFSLRYSFSKTSAGYKLAGSRSFSFSDFDLVPPKKVGGLVKVKDDFDVAFTLLLANCK